MQAHDFEYCDFREVTALVTTWNAGASKPEELRHDEQDSNFIRGLFGGGEPPDIFVIGLQELVDLDDKKETASKDDPLDTIYGGTDSTGRKPFQEQKQRAQCARDPQQCLPVMARLFQPLPG